SGVLDGEVWVTGFGPTDICAVAIWFGPVLPIYSQEQRAAAGWDQFQSKLGPEQRKWGAEYFSFSSVPCYDEAITSFIGKDTSLNSWHLDLLGTNPKHQRKGLSSALIGAVESKAAVEGVMMVLETTNDPSVVYYQKLGFVVC
ncbi:hypothetical protein B0H14DRAFT_3634690, partial [Mycena olivaceomarginata]